MKHQFSLLIIPLLLFAQTAVGQDASSIRNKYGPPIFAYSVSERIWMTPEFGTNGSVCKMRLYPKRISQGRNYLGNTLDYWELKHVLDELAPVAERGKPGLFFGVIDSGGGRSESIYAYDNVIFRFLKSQSPYFDPIKEKKTPVKTRPKRLRNHTDDEEMIVSSDAEIVTITWNQQQCQKE